MIISIQNACPCILGLPFDSSFYVGIRAAFWLQPLHTSPSASRSSAMCHPTHTHTRTHTRTRTHADPHLRHAAQPTRCIGSAGIRAGLRCGADCRVRRWEGTAGVLYGWCCMCDVGRIRRHVHTHAHTHTHTPLTQLHSQATGKLCGMPCHRWGRWGVGWRAGKVSALLARWLHHTLVQSGPTKGFFFCWIALTPSA